ncbi:MAG: hypothetical protein BWZ10_02282 [candidate division BRC1 bacterium ADurb.BinA364]|nr:MAG: hypothetical protein BWZ10_02282 [candidate division BRC1 bacterium ADurb.BinA364]
MAHATTALRKDSAPRPAPARGKKHLAFKSPWQRNSVRRRWTYLLIGAILLAAAVLIFGNIEPGYDVMLRLPLTMFGFAALPLLYPLARRLGVSRGTAVWALALLAASVPWLVLLRACAPCSVIPFFVVLGALCYTRVLADLAGAWLSLGLALVALSLANPWAGLGLALGLALHAVGWVRVRARWRALGLSGAIAAPARLASASRIIAPRTRLSIRRRRPGIFRVRRRGASGGRKAPGCRREWPGRQPRFRPAGARRGGRP